MIWIYTALLIFSGITQTVLPKDDRRMWAIYDVLVILIVTIMASVCNL